MLFTVTTTQHEKLREWYRQFENNYHGCCGGAVTYNFIVKTDGSIRTIASYFVEGEGECDLTEKNITTENTVYDKFMIDEIQQEQYNEWIKKFNKISDDIIFRFTQTTIGTFVKVQYGKNVIDLSNSDSW